MHRGSVETGIHQHENNTWLKQAIIKEQAQLEICRVHRPWTRRRSSTPEYTTLITMPKLQSPTNSHDIGYVYSFTLRSRRHSFVALTVVFQAWLEIPIR